MSLFTAAELAELRRADAEIDEEYALTPAEIRASRKRNREAELERMDPQKRKIAARQAAWKRENREKWNAYQRKYRQRRKVENGK